MDDAGEKGIAEFRTTIWTLVRRAGEEGSQGSREALAQLLVRYLPALRAHLLHTHTLPESQVDDLLQSFVSDKILQSDLLAKADQRRGKFRTLLLTALHRYVVDQWRAQTAKKRSGGRTLSLDVEGMHEPAQHELTPSTHFDIAWAREVVGEALQRMQNECTATGRPDVWGVFEARLVGPTLFGEAPMPYEELVSHFGLSTPRRATNVLITGKRMFARILRTVVGEYTPEDEIEAEIRQLRKDLSIVDS